MNQQQTLSRYVKNIKPGVSTFGILAKVKELEKSGKRVIDMGIGEPDMDTPEVWRAGHGYPGGREGGRV